MLLRPSMKPRAEHIWHSCSQAVDGVGGADRGALPGANRPSLRSATTGLDLAKRLRRSHARPQRGRRLLIEPLTSEGAKVYPSFLARPGAGSAITSLSLPPAVRANSRRRSTVTCGSCTPSPRSCLAMAWLRRVSSPSSAPAAAGLDGCRGMTSTRSSPPSWMTWNSPTCGSRVSNAKCSGRGAARTLLPAGGSSRGCVTPRR